MGYLPIFLYLASFIFLFVLVITNTLKSKRSRYYQALEKVVDQLENVEKKELGKQPLTNRKDLEEIEKHYQTLKASADKDVLAYLNNTVKPSLLQAKMQQYWYNNLVSKAPYSFVAKIMGHHPI